MDQLSRAIVSFRAGRAVRRGDTNWVDPSPTKGLISIAPSDDGLLHFYWVNRDNHHIEEDLILFPGDASFVPVTEAQGGRTYVLKFTSSDQRLFFWLQDADSSKDQENVTKLNNALMDSFDGGDALAAAGTASEADMAPSASATTSALVTQTAPQPTASSGVPGASAEEVARLRALVQSMGARSSGSGGGLGILEPELLLGDVLTAANLQPLLENSDLLQTTFDYLPPDLPVKPSREAIRKIVESPPFQASVRQLDQALMTGMLQGLMVGLGLPANAGMGAGAFLKAIAEQASRKQRQDASTQGDEMDTS